MPQHTGEVIPEHKRTPPCNLCRGTPDHEQDGRLKHYAVRSDATTTEMATSNNNKYDNRSSFIEGNNVGFGFSSQIVAVCYLMDGESTLQ